MKTLTLPELTTILLTVCSNVYRERPITGLIFTLLYRTGLRASEVLDVWRWSEVDAKTLEVKLSKREDSRLIPRALVPAELLPHLLGQVPFTMETYSSINNTFKYYAPGLVIESKKKRTTCHAFRYRYIKQLRADGQSVTAIAQHMGHKVEASTIGYIVAQVWGGVL